MVPIDKSLMDKSFSKKEINWINNYHKIVFKNLKGYMNKTELLRLKEAYQRFKILYQSSSTIILISNFFAFSIFLVDLSFQ